MHKRIKKMEIGGVSSGNIISPDMLKQLGLNLGNYNDFISASMNKIKSDIGKFKDIKGNRHTVQDSHSRRNRPGYLEGDCPP